MPDTSQEYVEQLLARVETVDLQTNAICTLHPRALEQAAERDQETADGRSRGPLHGVPVLVKDNVDTYDLPTTAGSLALADAPPPSRDAALVQRMRDAGMVLLGKTNLSEWANIRDERSTSGWSAYGGLTRNPYGLNRSAGGSSSGSGAAVAAGLTPLAVGTETDGSISCPAAFNGCVGIKPTVGLVPTDGVVPVSRSQDTPGPMARTVREAAALLTVLSGSRTDYAAHAEPGRLAGKRIGVPRGPYWGYSPHADAAAERAVALLAAEGATIVDHADLPELPEAIGADELLVLLAELRSGLTEYLGTRPGDVPGDPRRGRRVQPPPRRHRAALVRAVAVREGARRARGRQRGVRRGAGQVRGGVPRERDRQGAARAPAGRAGHPVVPARLAHRPGQRGALRRRLHRPDRDGGVPAAHRADRAGGRPPGRGVVLGAGRVGGDPGRGGSRLRGGPGPRHRPAPGADVPRPSSDPRRRDDLFVTNLCGN